MRFVDVKNDVAFRKIFGDENKKVILISILNAVLGLEGQERVRDVTLLNPFQLPRLVGEKSSIIDVRATDEKGRIQKAEEIAEKRAEENTRNKLILGFHENGVPLGTIATSVGISVEEVRIILDKL